MKKKILLVLPRNYEFNFINVSSIIKVITKKSGGSLVLSLATIAALTPPEFEVKIVDEDVEDIDFNESFDIVGIGGFSVYLNRAEEIAREYSARGALIVCGGSPASFSPDRWRPFSDVLILGEAERTWPRFLNDYMSGSHKKEYMETEHIDISQSPVPDLSCFSPLTLKKYLYGIVQVSRGCPYRCEFCSVHEYAGNKMRYKPVEKVIQEVEQLYQVFRPNIIFIADDNFTGIKSKAKEVLKVLRDWNHGKKKPVSFTTQLSIDAAHDEEFLELAAAAGLVRVSVGVETPNLLSLEETHKMQNLQRSILEDIKRFQEHGILVQAGCIVGFDHDDKSIFKQQLDFFNTLGIPNIQVMPLQAPDGSPLKRRMIEEGRYIDWESNIRANPEQMNSLNTFTIEPKLMNHQELRQGICWLLKNLYTPENFIHRMETFFRNYENSQKKQDLNIPATTVDWYGVGLVIRLVKYVMLKARREDRKIFGNMFQVVRKSSHPHKMIFLINFYLSFLNTQEIIHKSFPEIDTVTYPS
ncbi:MAG: radical SAM protein [Bacteroidia bacterium]|nr:MAG: radical SAM protein [Bacteroidia bacterium]